MVSQKVIPLTPDRSIIKTVPYFSSSCQPELCRMKPVISAANGAIGHHSSGKILRKHYIPGTGKNTYAPRGKKINEHEQSKRTAARRTAGCIPGMGLSTGQQQFPVNQNGQYPCGLRGDRGELRAAFSEGFRSGLDHSRIRDAALFRLQPYNAGSGPGPVRPHL